VLLNSGCTDEKKTEKSGSPGIASTIYGTGEKQQTWEQFESDLLYLMEKGKYKDILKMLQGTQDKYPEKKEAKAFYYGVAYFSNGDIQKAKDYLKKAENKFPGKTLYYYAHIARKEGNYAKADKLYKKAYALLKNPEVLSSMGDFYYENKKFDKAAAAYEKASKQNPDSYLDRYFLANIYFQKKKFEKSETLLKKALEINPRFRKAYIGLYAIEDKRGKKKEAYYYYSRALLLEKNYGKIIEMLENKEITFRDPRLTKFYLVSLFQSGLDQKAKQVLEKARKLYPGDPDIQVYYGISQSRRGHTDKALKFFDELMQKHPENFNVIAAYGDLLHEQGKTRKALDFYEKALIIEPSNTSYRYKTAEIYRKEKEFNKEYYHRGVLYLYQKQPREALEALLRVKEDSRTYRTHFYLGKVYAERENYPQAVEHYAKSIEKKPDFEKPYLEMAYVLMKQEKKKEALKQLQSYPGKSGEVEKLKKIISNM
jgi:tetratricopeptide (TPR) repeat protein